MELFQNYISIIIILSSISFNLSAENFSLIFPFTTIEKEEPELTTLYNDTITNEIIKNIIINELFIKLEVGTPPQKLNLRISVNSNDFFISKSDAILENNYPKKQSNFYFDLSKSSTFQYSPNKKGQIFFSHTHESETVIDNMNFYSTEKSNNQKNINNFEFFLAHKVNGPNHGIVGLKNYPYVEKRDDFFSSLKKYNLIKNKIWYIDFDHKNKNGTLIMGNYPHFDNNIIKIEKYKLFDLNHFEKIYSVVSNEKWDTTWGINFNKIYLENKTNESFYEILNKNKNNKNVILNPNFGVIIGSHSFKYIFEKTFLNKFLDNKICFQPHLYFTRNYEQKSFYYYYCKADYIEQMRKEFNTIKFEHKEFKFNFTLDFDDLYIRKKNFIFLRIIFDESNPNWIFGSPFFSKYTFIFDSDSKEIGFYSPNINNNILGENFNKNEKGNSTLKIFLHVLLGIVLIVVGIIVGKKLFGLKRKLRANELEEKFEYKPEEKQIQMY